MAHETTVVLRRVKRPGLSGYRIESIRGRTATVQVGKFPDRRVGDEVTNAEADLIASASRYDVTSKA
jgi:hypothetical protein